MENSEFCKMNFIKTNQGREKKSNKMFDISLRFSLCGF